ncbi:putative ABC transport system ATP-binding protein [Nocardioides daedukensis]|uniref:Putative ABC transport system ATP-binding protein n=1 Tax=Nocardioides daedukensis TaxID=634462 RepID=A0A7Y9UMN6_9ACTN|nr:ABC transporter ATP-binding protein [Nocardioides daedukensis]NYG57688.1 putative ABC transport system ATP-binding protein [Nocardioides daedukensis]
MTAPEMRALELRGVTLTYPDGAGRLTALDDVSMTVARGELVAVVGPSGSGKSSLLAVAATLIRPDTGRVRIDGHEVTGLSRAGTSVVRRARIGLIFQQPNLIESLTALEQLTVTASLSGRPRVSATPEALELLDAVGLSSVAGRRPGQLSGGQRQRVNIARALIGGPSLLLVDEPTSALDHERGHVVMDLIRSITRERGVGTVLVTHDTGHLRPDDQVVECLDGRLRPRRAPAPDPVHGSA